MSLTIRMLTLAAAFAVVLVASPAAAQDDVCHEQTMGGVIEIPCPEWHRPDGTYRPSDPQTVADIVGVWTDLVACESRFDPDAIGRSWDAGYFQFIPGTWKWVVTDLMGRPDLVTAHPYYGGQAVMTASIWEQLAAAEALASPRGQGLTAWTCYLHGRYGRCTAPSYGPLICSGGSQLRRSRALVT